MTSITGEVTAADAVSVQVGNRLAVRTTGRDILAKVNASAQPVRLTDFHGLRNDLST